MHTYKKSIETKQKILDATIALVLEKGYPNFNMKDIAGRLDMPRSLIYYYYKNKEDILTELYHSIHRKLDEVAEELTRERDDPILLLIVRYILHYRFVIQNAALRDFYFSRPAYVAQGREAVRTAVETCYSVSRTVFARFRPDASENELYAFVLSCDSLMRTLFMGLANGVLSMSLRDVILYFGESTLMVQFNISKDMMACIVDAAFALTDTVATAPAAL